MARDFDRNEFRLVLAMAVYIVGDENAFSLRIPNISPHTYLIMSIIPQAHMSITHELVKLKDVERTRYG